MRKIIRIPRRNTEIIGEKNKIKIKTKFDLIEFVKIASNK
jgi:hypothetical protein